jgi:hypothetical protein
MGNPSSEGFGILLWITIPLVVSLILRGFTGDGWKDLGIKPNFKGNAFWYVVVLFMSPVTTACILIIGRGIGLITVTNGPLIALGVVVQAMVVGILAFFLKDIFEEAAWRGHLASKVYSLRLNDFVGHIIVGLVWGGWHIPYYLFFLERSVLEEFTTLNLVTFISLSIVVMISWSFVYGEMILLTRSIWPVVLMHVVENALLIQLITEHHIRILRGIDWLISPMSGLISVVIFLAIGVGIRQLRIKKSICRKSSFGSIVRITSWIATVWSQHLLFNI